MYIYVYMCIRIFDEYTRIQIGTSKMDDPLGVSSGERKVSFQVFGASYGQWVVSRSTWRACCVVSVHYRMYVYIYICVYIYIYVYVCVCGGERERERGVPNLMARLLRRSSSLLDVCIYISICIYVYVCS